MKVLVVVLFLVILFCGSYDSAKTEYPEKFQFLSYGPKSSSPIRFEYSLILNVFGMDWCWTYIFCIEIAINETDKQCGLVWSSSAPGMLSANEILVFFDPQYLFHGFASDFHFLGVDRH